MTPEQKRSAKEGFAHAKNSMQALERDYPGLWAQLDRMRAERPVEWPDWCLLPMGAAVAVAQTNPLALKDHTIAQISALYAWRYSRSVYLVDNRLLGQLLNQVPDALTLDDFTGLPEWCVYVREADPHPEWPGLGLWAHLEHDANTGRPELRLLLDFADGAPMPIPVYLDRGSVTEAIGDAVATAMQTLQTGSTGADVRGGDLSVAHAEFAERVDAYLSVVAYLSRPEADIVHAQRPGARPVKPRKPKKDNDVWLVGSSL